MSSVLGSSFCDPLVPPNNKAGDPNTLLKQNVLLVAVRSVALVMSLFLLFILKKIKNAYQNITIRHLLSALD